MRKEAAVTKQGPPEYDAVSSFERQYLGPIEETKLKLLLPLVRLLTRLGVSPNMVSLLQIPLSVAFVFILAWNVRVAGVAFIIIVLLDGIDGALATYANKSTRFGKLFDPFCDHLREAIILAALGFHTDLNSFWLGVYVFVHVAFNLATFVCNLQRVSLPFAVKPSLIVYPLLWLYLLMGSPATLGSVISYGLVAGIVYMSVVVVQAGARIRKALSLPVTSPVFDRPDRKAQTAEPSGGQ